MFVLCLCLCVCACDSLYAVCSDLCVIFHPVSALCVLFSSFCDLRVLFNPVGDLSVLLLSVCVKNSSMSRNIIAIALAVTTISHYQDFNITQDFCFIDGLLQKARITLSTLADYIFSQKVIRFFEAIH